MQRRLRFTAIGAVLTVAVAACQDGPASPLPSSPLSARAASFSAGGDGGNSDAARECQKGGYATLYRTDGSPFTNAGECTSYAAQGGVLARHVTASFTNVSFSSCNSLTWGYEVGGVSTDVATKAYGCHAYVPEANASVTYLSTQTVHVYLKDNTCHFTFLDDGLHALVTGTNPQTIEITDGGGFCESNASMPRPPIGRGNLDVTKTVTVQ
jgi:hypothetical protein